MLRRERTREIAVAIHDVEPATFERCALIREWLQDHGVERATLLVIPARDLHPLGERSPEMSSWLLERQRSGDAIAQHGFHHDQLRPPANMREALSASMRGRSREFVGLSEQEARQAIDAGWRVLKLAGIEPDGFVAPAYAYTPALRLALPRRFRWWASLLRLHHATVAPGEPGRQPLAPAWGTTREGRLQSTLAPGLIRAGGLLAGRTLRLDVHPAALAHPRQMLALEWLLSRCEHSRVAVTYEELILSAAARASAALARAAPAET